MEPAARLICLSFRGGREQGTFPQWNRRGGVDTKPAQQGASGERQYHLTRRRRAVLEVLREARDHPTVAEIFARVRAKVPAVSYATIYSAVDVLVDRGEVIRWAHGRAASRYELRGVPHDHALCTVCGALLDIELPHFAEEIGRVTGQANFTLLELRIEVLGICQRCSSAAEGAARPVRRKTRAERRSAFPGRPG